MLPEYFDQREALLADSFERHSPAIFTYVYSRIRNVEESRDIVQDVFMQAFAKRATLREEAAVRAWLFQIAKNMLIGHTRRCAVEFQYYRTVAQRDEIEKPSPVDPADAAARNEELNILSDAIRRLSDSDQEILCLRYEADLTAEEIAQVLGIPKTRVRVRVYRAVQKLRVSMRYHMCHGTFEEEACCDASMDDILRFASSRPGPPIEMSSASGSGMPARRRSYHLTPNREMRTPDRIKCPTGWGPTSTRAMQSAPR